MTTQEKNQTPPASLLNKDKLIRKTIDPLNENLKKKYDGIIPSSELNGTINKFQSDKLIQHYDKYGTFDGFFSIENLPKMQSNSLATVSETENTWTNFLGDYSSIIAVVGLGIGLVWFKAAEGHLKLYEFLFSEKGLYRKFLEKIGQGKASVSESNLFLYNKALKEAQGFAKAASRIDNEKFGQREFLLFAKIQFCFSNNIEEYAGLQGNVDLLQAALQAQSSYITIHQIEMNSQASKQQEFYEYTYGQLQEDPEAKYLRINVQNKLAELSPQIKTEEGRKALESYSKAISELADSPFALKLLVKFKALHLDDYSNLRTISELINSLQGKDVENLNTLTYLVMANYDDFEAIAPIIGLTDKQSSPDIYARMIQYIALIYRYQASFSKFQQLIQVIRQWYKPYRTILDIRKEHSPETHWQPQDFAKEIPGVSLYLKYKGSLTDQKTGYTYIDFGEELENSTI